MKKLVKVDLLKDDAMDDTCTKAWLTGFVMALETLEDSLKHLQSHGKTKFTVDDVQAMIEISKRTLLDHTYVTEMDEDDEESEEIDIKERILN